MENLNLKRPAYPTFDWDQLKNGELVIKTDSPGFNKLEKAALIIAAGYIAAGAYKDDEQEGYEIARCSVNVAKLILEEANK